MMNNFPFPQEQPKLLWRASENYKLAGVNTIRLPLRNLIGKSV
jgi:hypothetical protein